jgi:hypothetical protein
LYFNIKANEIKNTKKYAGVACMLHRNTPIDLSWNYIFESWFLVTCVENPVPIIKDWTRMGLIYTSSMKCLLSQTLCVTTPGHICPIKRRESIMYTVRHGATFLYFALFTHYMFRLHSAIFRCLVRNLLHCTFCVCL